jgi:hypothetical protein
MQQQRPPQMSGLMSMLQQRQPGPFAGFGPQGGAMSPPPQASPFSAAPPPSSPQNFAPPQQSPGVGGEPAGGPNPGLGPSSGGPSPMQTAMIQPPDAAPPQQQDGGFYGGSPETNPNLRPLGNPQPWQGSPFSGLLDNLYARGNDQSSGLIPKFVNMIGRMSG